MIELFHEIKDAPIPTLLVVGGLIFLLLAVAGKISGRIEVPPSQQKWAGAIGAALLLCGIVLYLLPASPPPSSLAANPVSTSMTAAPSDSEPLPTAALPPTAAPPTAAPPPTGTLPPTAAPPTAAPPTVAPPQPPLRSPEESLRTYWQAVSMGQYETAWNLLSANFRWTTHHNDIADYTQGYRDMALCDATPGAMTVIASAADYALVYATVTYRKDTECAVSTLDLAFHLTPDHMRGIWLIDRVDLR